MKHFLLIPTCALVAVATMTSCQKEETSCLKLVEQLTETLEGVVDYDTAEAAAPRVEALMKRWQKAAGRPVALGSSSLVKSAGAAGDGADYTKALIALADQIARIQASYPGAGRDTEVRLLEGDDREIDRNKLMQLVGANIKEGEDAGKLQRSTAAADIAAGTKHVQVNKENSDFEGDPSSKLPDGIKSCYGSDALAAALKIREQPDKTMFRFDGDGDVIATPEVAEVKPVAPAEGEGEEAGAEEGEAPADADTETPVADTESADETDAVSTDDEDTSSSDDGFNFGDDDSASSDEESSDDEEPAEDEEETSSDEDETPADDEEDTPADDGESSDDDSSDDSGDGFGTDFNFDL